MTDGSGIRSSNLFLVVNAIRCEHADMQGWSGALIVHRTWKVTRAMVQWSHSLRAWDVCRLGVFDHQCLSSISRTGWKNRVNNVRIKKAAYDAGSENILFPCTKLWLDQTLCMAKICLPYIALFPTLLRNGRSHVKANGMWQREVRNCTMNLAKLGVWRPHIWGPIDRPINGLKTLKNTMSWLIRQFFSFPTSIGSLPIHFGHPLFLLERATGRKAAAYVACHPV